MRLRLLVVDSDAPLDLLRAAVVRHGHALHRVDGAGLAEALAQRPPDIVLSSGEPPLPQLPAGVMGLVGDLADPRLVHRVESLLGAVHRRGVVRITGGVVDREHACVHREGRVEHLTEMEAKLLFTLCDRPDEVFSAADLLAQVWGVRPDTRTRTLSVTIRRLRMKIEPEPNAPVHLITDRANGYRFVPAPEPQALPRPTTPLIGRAKALGRLREALPDPGATVTITGPGGIGKSRLAEEAFVAWARQGQPVFRVGLRGVSTPHELLLRLRADLGLSTVDRGTATQQLHRVGLAPELAAPALVWIDDAEGVADVLSEV